MNKTKQNCQHYVTNDHVAHVPFYTIASPFGETLGNLGD